MGGRVGMAEEFFDQFGSRSNLQLKQFFDLGEPLGIFAHVPQQRDARSKREQNMSEIVMQNLSTIRRAGTSAIVTHDSVDRAIITHGGAPIR